MHCEGPISIREAITVTIKGNLRGTVCVVVVVVALSWVKAEFLYPHHNYILG